MIKQAENDGRLEEGTWSDVTEVRDPIPLAPDYFANEPALDRACRIAGPDGAVIVGKFGVKAVGASEADEPDPPRAA